MSVSKSATTVFVSGASGFIAQNVIKQLLANGYKVIGSVRSESKGKELTDIIQSNDFQFAAIPDISAVGAFDDVLKSNSQISVFIHTASPVTYSAKDVQNELIKPAVEGTRNALNAIKLYGPQIKRVVVTSSFTAIALGKDFDHDKYYTEKDWNPVTLEQALSNPEAAYAYAKKMAEKTVWDFVETESPTFKVTVVNPTVVFGPQAFGVKDKSKLNLLIEMINDILTLKPDDEIPPYASRCIDVRDAAKAHLVAFEKEEAINQRLVLINQPFSNDLVAYIIKKSFPDINIPEGNLERSRECIAKSCIKTDLTKTQEILGFDYVPVEKTILDTIQQLYDA